MTKIQILICCLLHYSIAQNLPNDAASNVPLPNLPAQHLLRYLNTFPKVRAACEAASNNNCKLPEMLSNARQKLTNSSLWHAAACWGHERTCAAAKRLATPSCPGDHTGYVRSKDVQLETFFYQADFGYIRQQIEELSMICEPSYISDSSLECSNYLRFCRGRQLLFDFRDLLQRKELIRYQMDVLSAGKVAGHCRLNSTRLTAQLEHLGALQSWAPELRYFTELPMPVQASGACDIYYDVPTFIMKIDATYNMYHHFCDFFNLYASLFVNQSHPLAFDTNVQILIWETYPYDSPFAQSFKAFSHHPVLTLNEVKGKRVCFRNVVLPLLPRMIFGLYYNTPIINGCQQSGLFRAFSEFMLHRLQIPFYAPHQAPKNQLPKVRITFLARRTKYRQVLNEEELLAQLSADDSYAVQRISFERDFTFMQQLAITRNTDILIGMHGAGLTHLLFLPNWAAIFELYNCEDPNCYKDLARLRGVNYMTWQRADLVYPQDEGHHPQAGAHAKFTNYSFDAKEFARLVAQAAAQVRAHKEFQNYQQLPNEAAEAVPMEEIKAAADAEAQRDEL